MNIILFGGTFDPPLNKHKKIAEKTIALFPDHILWYVVTNKTEYFGEDSTKNPTDPKHRLEMTKLIEAPGILTSDLEVVHQLDGQTRHLISWLPKEHTYKWLGGSDQDFFRWKNIDELLEFMPFLIFPRSGYPIGVPQDPRMQLVQMDPIEDYGMDSTEVRRLLRLGTPFTESIHPSGKTLADIIPPGVLDYIQGHHLYEGGVQKNLERK